MFAVILPIACDRKVYSVKTIIILAALLLCNSVHAMQSERGMCHLAALPLEVRNLIAEYLVFRNTETDTEFIERTKIILPIDEDKSFKNMDDVSFCGDQKYISCSARNKQMTKKIVYHIDRKTKIFSCYIEEIGLEKMNAEKNKRTLDEYFRQNRVCKKIIISLE